VSRANECAYPADSRESRTFAGMTVRERFAMAAMEGIIASGRKSSSVVLDVAAEAREYADAMLDELAREPRK
jgi:hypothetical protein